MLQEFRQISDVKLYKRDIYVLCRMRYVAAYLLAAIGGKDNPNSADIEKILSSVGIEADAEKLKTVISELNGKNVEELIATGNLIWKIPDLNKASSTAAIIYYNNIFYD
jgi:hypothetical protein